MRAGALEGQGTDEPSAGRRVFALQIERGEGVEHPVLHGEQGCGRAGRGPDLQVDPLDVGTRRLGCDVERPGDLLKRYEAAGGQYFVCPICFNSKKLDSGALITGAELQGTVPLWEWIGDGATTFSY